MVDRNKKTKAKKKTSARKPKQAATSTLWTTPVNPLLESLLPPAPSKRAKGRKAPAAAEAEGEAELKARLRPFETMLNPDTLNEFTG